MVEDDADNIDSTQELNDEMDQDSPEVAGEGKSVRSASGDTNGNSKHVGSKKPNKQTPDGNTSDSMDDQQKLETKATKRKRGVETTGGAKDASMQKKRRVENNEQDLASE